MTQRTECLRFESVNNTILIQVSCFKIGVIYNMETNNNVESVIGFDALYRSMYKCKNNVMWKVSVSSYYLNGIEQTLRLERELKGGKYKPKPPRKFTITSPKKREAISITFRDRVYQRSMNDNIIYPMMTKSFIYDNCACQTGKGTTFARDRLDLFLKKFYRKNKLDGYVLQCDVKSYYPSMDHEVVDEIFKSRLPYDIYKMASKVLMEQYDGDVGYNPGSQMIQIAGITTLDGLDHFIKEKLRIKYYLRYMDDFILIHEDKEYLKRCKEQIAIKLEELKLSLHPRKTRIFRIDDGIKFLGFRHKITDTGKVIRLIDTSNVKRERKKLYRLVNLAKQGELTKEHVYQCYNSWREHASHGNTFKLLQRMDKYYKDLWRNT